MNVKFPIDLLVLTEQGNTRKWISHSRCFKDR